MGATNPGWKKQERKAAALFGTHRKPANTGGPMDFETDGYVGQVKFTKAMSLLELEREALAMERLGFQQSPPKLGVVVVKRKRGRRQLVVVTEAVWREMTGEYAIPTNSSHG